MGKRGEDFLKLERIPDNEWQIQKKFAGDAKVIFDLGAHRGRTVGRYLEDYPNASVYAFEPAPDNIKKFKERLPKLKGYRRVAFVPKAVSNYDGKVLFHLSSFDCVHSIYEPISEPAIETITVPCVTLDSFCEKKGILRINILKMDVEGAELRVLEGARGLLERNCIDLIYSELRIHHVHQGQCHLCDVWNFLKQYGFRLHSFFKDKSERRRILEGNGIFVRE